MLQPSEEQLFVVKSLISKNVVVDSVAGSGKTTTIKYIAMAFRQHSILVLMYNANQRINTKEELLKYGIKNVDVHTFHSCAYRYYGQECLRDVGIRDSVDSDRKPITHNTDKLGNIRQYDIIIIDEVQDMNNLYFMLSQKIIRDLVDPGFGRILLIGDYLQSINIFNGSRIDYILNPEKYFGGEWQKCTLTETFRLTTPMVDFVNDINRSFDSGYRKLVSHKQSMILPEYYICDMKYVYIKVSEYLSKHAPHEILLLTPSVRKNRQISELCNLLSVDGVPLYITGEVVQKQSRELSNGKLMISTIHAIKGDERPIVMLIGFDDSILPKMLNSDQSNGMEHSIIYVALTRAKERLLIFHNYNNAFIIPRSLIELRCKFTIAAKKFNKDHVNRKYKDNTSKPKSATDLVKYLNNDIIVECMKYINIERITVAEQSCGCEIANTVPSVVDGSFEDVSDINGFLIPAFHSRFYFDFYKLKGYFDDQYSRNSLLPMIKRYYNELTDFADEFFMDPYCGIDQLLRISTIYNGLRNNLFYKIEQIKEYNWVTYEFLDKCSDRINSIISKTARYEVVAQRGSVVGVIDAIDTINGCEVIYELKCTSMIEEEHILQLALYAYLLPNKKYRLYNIYTNELIELTISNPTKIAELLLNR